MGVASWWWTPAARPSRPPPPHLAQHRDRLLARLRLLAGHATHQHAAGAHGQAPLRLLGARLRGGWGCMSRAPPRPARCSPCAPPLALTLLVYLRFCPRWPPLQPPLRLRPPSRPPSPPISAGGRAWRLCWCGARGWGSSTSGCVRRRRRRWRAPAAAARTSAPPAARPCAGRRALEHVLSVQGQQEEQQLQRAGGECAAGTRSRRHATAAHRPPTPAAHHPSPRCRCERGCALPVHASHALSQGSGAAPPGEPQVRAGLGGTRSKPEACRPARGAASAQEHAWGHGR